VFHVCSESLYDQRHIQEYLTWTDIDGGFLTEAICRAREGRGRVSRSSGERAAGASELPALPEGGFLVVEETVRVVCPSGGVAEWLDVADIGKLPVLRVTEDLVDVEESDREFELCCRTVLALRDDVRAGASSAY
jgi:hypothetical protein